MSSLKPTLPDVPTFLSHLSTTLQGRSLTDLPHVTFPSGTYILVALPVHVNQHPGQQQPTYNPDQSESGKGKSRKPYRHAETQTPGPALNMYPAKMDGIVHYGLSNRIKQELEQDEAGAYSMLCDIIEEYSAPHLDPR